MKPEEFTSFDKKEPKLDKHIIVTNNLEAKDANGEMSHVWMVIFWKRTNDRGIISFTDSDRKIIGLTHWKYA